MLTDIGPSWIDVGAVIALAMVGQFRAPRHQFAGRGCLHPSLLEKGQIHGRLQAKFAFSLIRRSANQGKRRLSGVLDDCGLKQKGGYEAPDSSLLCFATSVGAAPDTAHSLRLRPLRSCPRQEAIAARTSAVPAVMAIALE